MKKLYFRLDNGTKVNVFRHLIILIVLGAVIGITSSYITSLGKVANNINGTIIYTDF